MNATEWRGYVTARLEDVQKSLVTLVETIEKEEVERRQTQENLWRAISRLDKRVAMNRLKIAGYASAGSGAVLLIAKIIQRAMGL